MTQPNRVVVFSFSLKKIIYDVKCKTLLNSVFYNTDLSEYVHDVVNDNNNNKNNNINNNNDNNYSNIESIYNAQNPPE